MSKTILFAASSKINVLEDNTLITAKYTEYVESLLSAEQILRCRGGKICKCR